MPIPRQREQGTVPRPEQAGHDRLEPGRLGTDVIRHFLEQLRI
ncbi:MAG TPA: hypothetical protein PLM79_01740 [Syntrophobacteraceae bacterium]|nr:hypothetical protein [Syntrophobacteraceae bacterium]